MGADTATSLSEEAEETVLQLKVPNISRLEDVAFSKIVQIKDHQWRLMVVHREVTQASDGKKDVMGAYLQHVGLKSSSLPVSALTIVVNVSLTLVNQAEPDKSFTKEFRHRYTRDSTDWGYSTFLRWKVMDDLCLSVKIVGFLQDVVHPTRGFVKDDTIVLRARLIFPDPDAHVDSTPSSSQSHNTPSQSMALPTSQNHAYSHTQLRPTHSSGTNSQSQSLSISLPNSQTFSLSQSSQGECSQLTPTTTSVLPPEMATFLSCPRCTEPYEEEGNKSPNTLHCGHTFCLDCLVQLTVKGEGGKEEITCSTCGREHVGSTSDSKPWFPNHSMIQLIGSVISKAKHFCPIHQHDRNYYCFHDNTLVCIYCAYHGEHAAHQCRPVDDAKKTIRDRLRPVRIQAQGRMTELERRVQLMKDEQEGMRAQTLSSARLVEEYFVNLETALHKQRDHLLQDLQSHATDLHTSLESQVRDLEKTLAKVRRSLEEYDKWKAQPAREALAKVATITQTLQATASTPLPQQSSCPQLRVCVELPCTSPLTSLGSLGHVTVTCPSPSPSPGASNKTQEQEGKVTELDGNTHLESQREQAEDDGEPIMAVDSASGSDTVADPQDGDNPTGGMKRKSSDTSPVVKMKKRKT